MPELLDGLERAARAPRRRRLAIAGAAAVALAAAAAALVPGEPDEEALAREAAESRIGAVWNAERRGSLRAAFAGAGEPGIAELGDGTGAALDGYRDAWLAMRIDAWSATNRRKEQSPRLLEQRMRCLDRLVDEVDAFVQIAAEAVKPDELRRAGQGVGRLTPVSTCADEVKIAAIFPAAVDAADHPEVRRKFEVEEARMRAAIAAKPPAAAIQEITAAVAEAERAGVPGLASGLLFLLAVTQNEAADFPAAEATLRKMIDEAARARRHSMVAAGWLRLMQSLSSKQSRLDEAIALEPIARVAVAQAGDEPDLRAELATTLAGIAFEKQDMARARDRFQEARDVMIAAHGPKNEVAAGAEVSLAMTQFQMGALDDAARSAQHAYDILASSAESDRSAGKALMVLSWVARERKDWAAAVRHGQASVAALARLHGTDNLELAFARRELGLAFSQLDRHDEAIEEMSQCVATFKRVGPTHPDTLSVHLELGSIYERAKRYDDAEKIDRAAVDVLRTQGIDGRDRLGDALLELGRMVAYRSPADAVPLYDEGVRIATEQPGHTAEEHAEALAVIARTGLAAGRARWALGWFDRLPKAAAKLPDLRRELVAAAKGGHVKTPKRGKLKAAKPGRRARASSGTARRSGR